MANKNTRNVNRQIRKAGKRGESTATVSIPSRRYPLANGRVDGMIAQVRPTSLLGSNDTVSSNRRRNMAMRVYRNRDESGKKDTVTVHEPLLKGEFVTFKGHDYMRKDESNGGGNNYRQFKQDSSRPVAA